MLFTVVESRDARLVAESHDRQTKLTLEGGAPAMGFVVGQTYWLSLVSPDSVSGVVAVGQPQPVLEVTHDLSDDQVGRNDPEISVDEQAALDSVPLADESEAK